MRKGRVVAWVLLIVWTLGTAFTLTVPLPESPTFVGRGFDKVVHTGMFTVMGVFAQAAAGWYAPLFGLPIAVGLEYAQKLVPERTFDRVEVVANVLGFLIGVGCFEAAWRLRRK